MLSKAHRITRKLFSLLRKNKVYEGGFFSLRVFTAEGRGGAGAGRASVVVSKKIAQNATLRNKIKRQVYAILEKQIYTIKKDVYIIVYTKKNIEQVSFKTKKEELEGLLQHIFL